MVIRRGHLLVQFCPTTLTGTNILPVLKYYRFLLMEENMKVNVISGIVLMTLSSLSFAAMTASNGAPVNDLSRSPFQVDRDKAHTQKVVKAPGGMSGQPLMSAGQLQTKPMAATSRSSVSYQEGKTVVSSSAAMTLQENHLLSQDIAEWARKQGLRPLWNSNRDYLIYSTITLTGKDRDGVLSELGQLFRSENYGLVIKLYEKNNVLVIDAQ